MTSTASLVSDDALLAATRGGDEAAFATLYRMYNPYLDVRIRREIGSLPLEACDISQQVWAQTFAATTSGSKIENLFGYLHTVAGRVISAHRGSLVENPTESLEKLAEVGHTPETSKAPSAEQSFFDYSLDVITDNIHHPAEDTRQPYVRIREQADALAQYYGFDTPITRPSNATRRMLVEQIDQVDTFDLLTSAIRAQIVITGQAMIPPPYDPEITGMFAGWSVPDLEELLTLPARDLRTLVHGAVAFPSKPSETHRRALRAQLTALSDAPGWTKTARALERAWIAEWFDALAWADHTRECVEAEAERIAVASTWDASAEAAIRFSGQPLGRFITTTDAVNDRLGRLLIARRRPAA